MTLLEAEEEVAASDRAVLTERPVARGLLEGLLNSAAALEAMGEEAMLKALRLDTGAALSLDPLAFLLTEGFMALARLHSACSSSVASSCIAAHEEEAAAAAVPEAIPFWSGASPSLVSC